MAIQMRRGADSDFSASKMLPGELAVTTDGTRKVYAAFGTNDVKELASKDDVQGLINSFISVVDREIAEAEQRIESKAETVLGTIPDEYEIVSQKADEAVRTKADAIVCTVSGVTPIATDSSDDYLRNLRIFGKTTQETTSGKNLLENTGSNATANGITYTINEDKSITVVGTATATGTYTIGSLDIEAGEYILTGCPSGGSGDTFMIAFGSQAYSDTGSGVTRSFTETTNVSVYLILTSGTVMNHTFYPMIRLASITDGEYEPYTGGIASPSPSYPQPLESKGKWGNLLENTAESKTENGITWTVLEDGRVVANGTATAVTYLVLARNISVTKGMKLSGCPSGGSTSKHDLQIYGTDDNVTYYYDFGSGVEITEDYDNCSVCLTIRQSVTVNNFLFEPMLTYAYNNITSYRPYSGQREVVSGVYGKNLSPINEVTAEADSYFIPRTPISLKGGKTHTFSMKPSSTSGATLVSFWNSSGEMVTKIEQNNTTLFGTITPTEDITAYQGYTNITNTYSDIQIELGEVVTDYVPYTKQFHISLVGDGLKGIPVTDVSLATYTDENGQMWCSDYVDCDKGVLVQRIVKIVFDGGEGILSQTTGYDDNTPYFTYVYSQLLNGVDSNNITGYKCNKLIEQTPNHLWMGRVGFAIDKNDNNIRLRPNIDGVTDVTTFKTKLKEWYDNGEPLIIVGIRKTPIETPLSASEIASYKALKSNYKVTSVVNDCDAYEEVTYNADTETWINNKIEARVASALASLALS